MILADKIIALRRKQGWSQEELAERLDVSRQSVSKWEGGQSIPDLNKILSMSALFGVSTDYLLKDEIEAPTPSETEATDDAEGHSISPEVAEGYLNAVKTCSYRIALGVAFCILSPVLLISLLAFTESGTPNLLPESIAVGAGLFALFALVLAAVALFIPSGMALSEFSYLETERIVLDYGVKGITEKKREVFLPRFRVTVTFSVILCICSVLPLVILGALGASDFAMLVSVAALLAICAVAVGLMVWACFINGSYQKLLQLGDYTEAKKKEQKENEAADGAYWGIATALYLGISFLTFAWHWTWVIWPVAGCLYPLYLYVVKMIRKENEK